MGKLWCLVHAVEPTAGPRGVNTLTRQASQMNASTPVVVRHLLLGHLTTRMPATWRMNTKAFLKSRDQRERVEMRFAHLRAITASSACGSEACPAPAMGSTSPRSFRT